MGQGAAEVRQRRVPAQDVTEWVPQLPPRRRITARLREQADGEVTGRGITPTEAARHAGISWPVAYDAFASAADPLLDQPAAVVAHLGMDEHRRGRRGLPPTRRPGGTSCSRTGCIPASLSCPASRGLLGQMQGSTADDAAYWLAGATSA